MNAKEFHDVNKGKPLSIVDCEKYWTHKKIKVGLKEAYSFEKCISLDDSMST